MSGMPSIRIFKNEAKSSRKVSDIAGEERVELECPIAVRARRE
jgi:hypothetical protein